MIRTAVFRNPILKSALKKDLSAAKFVRSFIVVFRPNRKKLTYRNVDLGIIGTQISKNTPTCRFYSDYPNHYKVTLPALSPTMETGTIISWEKKEGDKLNEGDLLAEIETDKATMGFETPEEGYLAKILVPAGTKNVPIGKLVCIIVQAESDVAAFKDYVDTEAPPAQQPMKSASTPKPSAAKSTPPPASGPPPPPPLKSPASISGSTERIYASPLAKKIALEKGLSLESVGKGSGIYGSITSQDLSRATDASLSQTCATQFSASYTDVPMYADLSVSSVRHVIAKRVLEAKQSIPHYYLVADICADNLLILKDEFNEMLKKENIKISLNDFVIKAVASACKKVPEANSSWMDTFIRQYNTVDISVGVNTDRGLAAPVIFNADMKGLATISAEIKHLSAKAREGTLLPEEYQGGTITVTNLSMYGISSFSTIINPPQVCVLGVGALNEHVVEDKKRSCRFKTSKVFPVTLSCDHRVVDGAIGAQWLSEFKKCVENPTTMLL